MLCVVLICMWNYIHPVAKCNLQGTNPTNQIPAKLRLCIPQLFQSRIFKGVHWYSISGGTQILRKHYFSGRMKWFIGAFTVAAILAVAQSESSFIDYSAQVKWPGVCTTGKKQSPINVITSNVQCNANLTPLTLNNAYYQRVSGTFKNNGHSVDFTPDTVNAIMATPVGNYKLKSFHMHWGAGQGKGSEHLVNGVASELEVHFVHEKVNAQSTTASDYYAVLSVRGSMQYDFTYGIFSQLDVTKIINSGTEITVSDIYMPSLLPYNGDYYYYQGSLTTPTGGSIPTCSETVQWFLLKNTIAVPLTFLANLRKVRDNSGKIGNPITTNYRKTQPLNGRIVTQVC